ncbi:hypothetical protein [Virgibacillus sp. CBA3643]
MPIAYSLFGYLIENMGTVAVLGLAEWSIIGVSLLGLTNKRLRQLD